MTFLTLAAVKQANAAADHHFFDRDTMRFFSSRALGPVMGGRFFITTERRGFDDYGRGATIRCALNSGSVETVGEGLNEYGTPDAARRAIRAAIKSGDVTVRFDPYRDRGTEQAPPFALDRYEWRAYVGDLPIGGRTTNAAATRIAAEVCESV